MDLLDAISRELADEAAEETLTLNRIGFEPRPLLWHTIKQYVRTALRLRLRRDTAHCSTLARCD